ncbi:MAG TPA: Hsp20/alpha crystallin family protein, partial [Blastocatellia bacterium]|nr:Hsp20/alpha crystallin family protein [Blastocatellia bacterium]
MAKTGTAIAVPFRVKSLFGQDPFGDLSELQRGFNRAFADAFGAPGAESVGAWAPKVDIFEDENGFLIKLELPEIKREDVKVTLDKNVLSISGERKLENEEKR